MAIVLPPPSRAAWWARPSIPIASPLTMVIPEAASSLTSLWTILIPYAEGLREPTTVRRFSPSRSFSPNNHKRCGGWAISSSRVGYSGDLFVIWRICLGMYSRGVDFILLSMIRWLIVDKLKPEKVFNLVFYALYKRYKFLKFIGS